MIARILFPSLCVFLGLFVAYVISYIMTVSPEQTFSRKVGYQIEPQYSNYFGMTLETKMRFFELALEFDQQYVRRKTWTPPPSEIRSGSGYLDVKF